MSDEFFSIEISSYQDLLKKEKLEKEKLLLQIKELKEEVFEAWQESDQWRITIEEALEVKPDPKNHDMSWAFDAIRQLKF